MSKVKSPPTTLRGKSIFTGQGCSIQVSEGKIVSNDYVDDLSEDEQRVWISPGFFDIQVNGFLGSDYSLSDLSHDHIRSICASLATAGTTKHVPTIVTSPHSRIIRNLETMADAMDSYAEIRDAIPLFHIEGPYISPEDGPRGAHDPQYLRDPDLYEYQEWQAASRNRIGIVTLAPERRGAIKFIEHVAADGVLVSIGHSAADPETIVKAVEAGAKLSTHLGNGSHEFVQRLHNYLWQQLAEDRLFASIICDGYHLPKAVVNTFLRTKTLDRLILVSDAALLGGLEPGQRKWGDIDVEIHPDGHLSLVGTAFLAGAGHLLDWDIAHFIAYTGARLSDAIRLCTNNPALLLGLNDYCSMEMQRGSVADLCVFRFSKGDKKLTVEKTMRCGNVVWSRQP